MSSTQKKVVIVGGQFAGRKAFTLLEKDFDVTIIDSKEYFEFTPAALRAIVEPAHAAKIIVDRPRAAKVARAERIELTDGTSRATLRPHQQCTNARHAKECMHSHEYTES
jgi:NADH dehydrogenase FAD-containing subunit